MQAKHAFYLILNDSPFPGTCELQPYHSEEEALRDMKRLNIKLKKSSSGSKLQLWQLLSAEEALADYADAVRICNNMK